MDLDEAAAIGALCSLGEQVEAEALVLEMRRRRPSSAMWMTACTLAVWCSTNLPTSRAQPTCERVLRELPETEITFAVRNFLAKRGVNFPCSVRRVPVNYNEHAITHVGFAELTQNPAFMSFSLGQPGAGSKFRLLSSDVLTNVFGR
ncbi:MAG: hypothetical protein R3F14_08850 [Polyangiaceae bacterium]